MTDIVNNKPEWDPARANAEVAKISVIYSRAKQQKNSANSAGRLNVQDVQAAAEGLGLKGLTSAKTITDRLKYIRGEMAFDLDLSVRHLGDSSPFVEGLMKDYPQYFTNKWADTPAPAPAPAYAPAPPKQMSDGRWVAIGQDGVPRFVPGPRGSQ